MVLKNNMTKYPRALFCLLAAFLLVSCDNNTEVENTSAVLSKDSTLADNNILKVSTRKYILKSKDQEAVMEWPQVEGEVTKEALRKMNQAISIDTVCGESIDAIQKNYSECSCGTVGSGYSVNYNKRDILSLSISVETMGAYPDGYLRSYNFSVKTGEGISIDHLIKKDSLSSLIMRLNAELTKRVEESKAMAEEDAEKSDDNESLDDLFSRTEFSKDDLKSFIITDKGITFYFDFGFPHAFQALEPAGDFFISNEELKPYLNAGIEL
jgi:hypothetical protein